MMTERPRKKTKEERKRMRAIANAERKHESESENKLIATGLAGVTAGAVSVANFDDSMKSINHEYSYKEYKCTNKKTGAITGGGYHAEDIFMDWCKENGIEYEPGYDKSSNSYPRHGADCKLGPERELIQEKCCKTPKRNVKSLFDKKTGEYKYDGQSIMVPKNQGEKVAKRLQEIGIETDVIESPYTYEESQASFFRGSKSLKIDAKRVWNKNCGYYLGGIILGSAAGVIAGRMLTPKEKRSFKKDVRNLLYGAAASFMAVGIVFSCQVGTLQMMRPA